NSMTGYGRASLIYDESSIEIEISSVNKRHLETIFSAPKEWQRFEYEAAKEIKAFFERGRIRIAINVVKKFETEDGVIFDESLIESDLDQLETFLKKKNQTLEVSPDLILQLANLRKNQAETPALNKVLSQLKETLVSACKEMLQMRMVEGLAMKEDLLSRINLINNYILEIEEHSIGMIQEHQNKLLDRLEKSNLSLDQDDDRVLKEVVLFAEKSDTSEEITRLKSHLVQMKSTIEANGCIGRKLEFLLQEISRELNTFCSKSTRTNCTNIALNARTEVEKMREQALNIE
ncbi:MAG: YicC family protein, partial [Opitutae bacterium]|nr:YicC family protein [Opitutae bacterium]